MENIGQRIKELRRKRDLTQEKLADFLCVSYQAVSKWECGVANPDITMIGPLTKVLGVSADELLGLVGTEESERRATLEAEYVKYHIIEDHTAGYHMACEAVRDYPDEIKYKEWLATMEYTLAYDAEAETNGTLCGCRDFFEEMMENSIRHYEYVIDNSDDRAMRNRAIFGIAVALLFIGRYEEALWYAETVYGGVGIWDTVQRLESGIPLRSRPDYLALLA